MRWTRCLWTLAAAMPAAGCLEADDRPATPGSAEAVADPAPLRAGPPRLRLGSRDGEDHTDFHDVAGVVVNRPTDALVVANRGDATLRAFTLDGEWRSTRGGLGDGPRELEELTAIFPYRGDSLAVYDDERGDVSIWPYPDGDVRRVSIPPLPGDTLHSPRFHGAMADGRLVWTAVRPDRVVDGIGESHPRHLVIFLTSAEGAGFHPIAETAGARYFQYGGDTHISGRVPFSPRPFVLPADSTVLFGSTEQPRADRVSHGGAKLPAIVFSLTPSPVTGADRERALAAIRSRLNRPLPASLGRRLTATLDVWAFPDSFPVLGHVVAGRDGRVWVTGYRPPEEYSARSESARKSIVWSAYAGPDGAGFGIEFAGDFHLLWADDTEAVGVVRDELDIEHVLIVPLSAVGTATLP